MTQPNTPGGPPVPHTSTAVKVLAALGALVVVPGGAFLAAANVGTGGKVVIAVAVAWWVVASAVIGKFLLQRRPDLRTPVRATLAVAAVASVIGAYFATRPTTVDEQIATAGPGADLADTRQRDAALAGADDQAPAKQPASNVQLLSGEFAGQSGHSGSGDASVIKLRDGGRVLTFSNFDVDPGAGGLRVYLHAGKSSSDDLGDFIDLAALKGTNGDQQYEIPADVDLRRYSSVLIWCDPFTTRIAEAPLS